MIRFRFFRITGSLGSAVAFLVAALVAAITPCLHAQTHRTGNVKAVPASADYLPSTVWVKLKHQYATLLSSANGRAPALPGVISAQPLVPGSSRPVARRGPLLQHIDINRYHTLTLEPGSSMDEVLSSLAATGYFDAVEPVFNNRPLSTPNDPSFSAQPYLGLIRATEAWDITYGDESVIIGIVDTGGDLDHPDLADKLYVDPFEPIDGLDNDGDGYVDNAWGWDFSGDQASAVGSPGFVGDNNPGVAKGGLFGHGTMVAGCAAASTDNATGIASVGRSAKLLFTKHFSDDQDANASNYSSNTYLGVLYAATHGARIINCSWGSYNPSTIAQDIINYVTLDLGCLVIAAAGNSNLETPIYPASYDNVISVGSTTMTDERVFFSNYGRTLDLVAPGADIFTTQFNDAYVYESGTSLSAPIVSGAAALVWSLHPEYGPLQVAEQLRVSADASIYEKNPLYLHKLGYGRLDVLSALTRESPSVRVSRELLTGIDNGTPTPGSDALLYLDFTNYLKPASSALSATISSSSPFVSIVEGSYLIGALGTGETRRNNTHPFQIAFSSALPLDEVVEILVTITDGAYQDYQLINVSIPSYVDIRENNIITSLAGTARVGYGAPDTQSNGSGFLYNEEQLLFEMGLMVGTSPADMQNNVRATGGVWDADFQSVGTLKKATPGKRSYSEVSGTWASNDERVQLSCNTMVWNEDPDRNFIIFEYTVKNASASAMDALYFGLFADWDIADQGAHDRAGWDADTRLGYVLPVTGLQLPRAGIQALTGSPQYHAIDNDQTIAGNPFGLYDGFSDDEKFTSISSGIARTQAGVSGSGGDVSHVVGSGPYALQPGETVTIAFALHAAMSQDELLASARRADRIYNHTLKAPLPEAGDTLACKGMATVLKPKGATRFSLYKSFTGGTPVATASTLPIGPVERDTVVYIANADQSFESLRVPVMIRTVARPIIEPLTETELCEGGSTILTASEGDGYRWSTGETVRSIVVTTSGSYSVEVLSEGVYCPAEDNRTVLVHALPDASFNAPTMTGAHEDPATFTANQREAISWLWELSGAVSEEVYDDGPDFTYQFTDDGSYFVSLTVTDENNCVNQHTTEWLLVTGLEGRFVGVDLYPNPVTTDRVQIHVPAGADVLIEVFDLLGRRVMTRQSNGSELLGLDVHGLDNGQYMLRITAAQKSATYKFVLSR